ncbi:biotin/lipoyl-binding protein [Burkholderia glumae]|uniref:biotin/lipoyl-binding protein n=1 Tax=Burkholderia glumae TaxID=337 RepID=UPI0021517758|nr:biotin/lipoyl-binding protein [Burkholderia glumae]
MNRTDNPQAAAGAAAPPPAEPALPDRRRRYFRWFFIALALAALAGGYWWIASRDTETTDDAYVTGDVVQVSPQVAGTVDAIMVQNAEWVRAGDPLFRIDPTDARLALDDAVAQLARASPQHRSCCARPNCRRRPTTCSDGSAWRRTAAYRARTSATRATPWTARPPRSTRNRPHTTHRAPASTAPRSTRIRWCAPQPRACAVRPSRCAAPRFARRWRVS